MQKNPVTCITNQTKAITYHLLAVSAGEGEEIAPWLIFKYVNGQYIWCAYCWQKTYLIRHFNGAQHLVSPSMNYGVCSGKLHLALNECGLLVFGGPDGGSCSAVYFHFRCLLLS